MRGAFLVLVSGLVLVACDANPKQTPITRGELPPVQPTFVDEMADSIGSASMTADGTIVLLLRAESGQHPELVGDALFEYPPSHPQYKQVLDHLGGLRPGENKPVPPWP